jgi:hypothetical protein
VIFFLITIGLPTVLAAQMGFKKRDRAVITQKNELILKKIFFMNCPPELYSNYRTMA